MGKGSTYRPVDKKRYDRNYERIFSKSNMRYKKKPKPSDNNFTIVFDDREHKPWLFLKQRWPMVRKRLKVGDYSIEGFEDKIAIEKKSGLAELLSDLTAKNRSRFERFLKKLSKVPIRAIIVDDEISNLQRAVALLRKKSKTQLTEQTVYYWLAVIICKYNIPIIFRGYHHNELVIRIFEQCKQKTEEL